MYWIRKTNRLNLATRELDGKENTPQLQQNRQQSGSHLMFLYDFILDLMDLMAEFSHTRCTGWSRHQHHNYTQTWNISME